MIVKEGIGYYLSADSSATPLIPVDLQLNVSRLLFRALAISV
jgi:hypothetical protein